MGKYPSASSSGFFREIAMSANSKKSFGRMLLLMLLGVISICGGTGWLALVVPAAMLIWYGAGSGLRSGRN